MKIQTQMGIALVLAILVVAIPSSFVSYRIGFFDGLMDGKQMLDFSPPTVTISEVPKEEIGQWESVPVPSTWDGPTPLKMKGSAK